MSRDKGLKEEGFESGGVNGKAERKGKRSDCLVK
jgi:hypothetical protein